MTKEEIGLVLKQLRVACGMTQKEVAEKIGRKQQIIGHWETGYAQPDANTLFLLCDIYGTTVDEAFGFLKNKNISASEYDYIKKYRSLDPQGKKHIDYELNREVARVKELTELKKNLPNVNIEIAEEHALTRSISYRQRLASAGTGQVVFEDMPIDRIKIPDIPKYRRVSYAIGVNGHSMEPLYNDGDILLIEPTCQIDVGEIGIFIVDGEAYVKKLGNGELISLNKGHANIALTEYSNCMGRVVDKLQQDYTAAAFKKL